MSNRSQILVHLRSLETIRYRIEDMLNRQEFIIDCIFKNIKIIN